MSNEEFTPKKRSTIGDNVKLVIDENLVVDEYFQNALIDVADLLEKNSGQRLYAIYINEDKDLQGQIFSLVVKFVKKE